MSLLINYLYKKHFVDSYLSVIYHTRKYCIVYSQMYCINTVQGRQKLQGIDSDRAIGQYF